MKMSDYIVSVADIEELEEDFENYGIRRKIELDFLELEKITDKWGFIRQIYMENLPDIMEASKNSVRRWIDPYFLDWINHFSPIEEIAWNSIRGSHYIPLYPQFPVFNYFIDFANPYLRIGLELDGKNFHAEEKDAVRDQVLSNYGWKIFRVKGSECYTSYKHPSELSEEGVPREEQFDEIENWIMNTCDGVVKAIRVVYFSSNESERKEYLNLALKSLDKHRLANFELIKEYN
jgi:hypothetical protein